MASRPLPEPAGSLYAPYIEELQEFFATSGLHYGTPPDIFAISERLYASENFFEDMASLVRSIILRQGGSMSQAELLRILAYAVGGPQMELAPQVYRQPLRHLLNFVTGVLRRPWNLPPGPSAEVVTFPPTLPNLAAAETQHSEPNRRPQEPDRREPGAAAPVVPIPNLATVPEPSSTAEQRVDAEISEAAAKAMAQPRHSASETPSLAPLAALTFAAPPPASETPPAAAADTPLAASEPIPEPTEPSPVQEPPAPNPPLSARPFAEPPVPPSNLIAGAAAAVFAILLIGILYHFSAAQPKPQAAAAAPATPTAASAPATSTTSTSAAAAPLPAAPVSTNPPSSVARPASAADSDPDQPTAASSATPPTHRSVTEDEDADYTAPPTYHSYVNPPPQPIQPAPTAAAPPSASSPRATLASSQSATIPAPANAFLTPESPTGTLPVRGSRSTLTDHPGYLDASSGIMSSNLISAPMPDYPILARLAHVHGQVVLQAVVSAGGSVTSARVLSGPRLLRGAAVDAVRRWRYHPYLVQGRPTDVSTIVTLNFHDAR